MGVDENGTDQMDVDPKSNGQQRRNDPGASQRPNSARKSEEVDYNSRRQSVVAGTKRKASSDKVYPPPGNEDIDPQLVGPGVSSGMNVDSEGPAPKRRGSAIDTQRIAQLSLYDRRNSVDARLGVGGPQWWGDRRDSGSSAFSNTPVTGYTTPASAFPGDSPHGRPPGGIATFAWPVIPPLDQSAPPAMQNEPAPNMSGPPHPYDPLTIMPPVTFAPDRRMSAPASSPENLSTPASTGPTRVLRSRSRPPSRVRNVDQSVNNHAGQSASSPGAGTSTEDASSSLLQPSKESGSTPYSRSPELRVSHKLAERKRRKEMKDLFDELRDQLPADRGMKASKWEILSKAIDFIVNLKQSHQDMGREIEMLRHELESFRQGIPPPFPGGPPHPVVYGHGPPVGMPGYPPPGGPAVPLRRLISPHTIPMDPFPRRNNNNRSLDQGRHIMCIHLARILLRPPMEQRQEQRGRRRLHRPQSPCRSQPVSISISWLSVMGLRRPPCQRGGAVSLHPCDNLSPPSGAHNARSHALYLNLWLQNGAQRPPSLFHPKRKKPTPVPPKNDPAKDGVSPSPSTSASTPTPGTPSRQPPRVPRPRRESAEDEKPKRPEGVPLTYRLMSSALNGWKYDVMKFDSRKDVEIDRWAGPVKLNRKEPRRPDEGPVAAAPQPVGPMLGPDGKPVIGADGKMTYAAGRDEKGKEKAPPKKRFQKKTKQVFLVPEATRQLRREERFPWVMEDSAQQEVWVGKMEEIAKSQTHAMFMPAAQDVFKFVPAHRWYKFQKKPNYRIPNLEEAESLMQKMQKNKAAVLNRRMAPRILESMYSSGQSLGPGGRRLRTVDNGMGGLFGDDEEEEATNRKRRMKREYGADGDMDELDFEEDFADDEERMEPEDREDEEAKELEERLKREYTKANKYREGNIDVEESDESEDETKLTGAGKSLQKTLRKLEKDGGYDDSDEEKNPYASSEEEEEEEIPQAPTGPAILPPPEPRVKTRSPSTVPSGAVPKPANGLPSIAVKTEPQSRATSPVPASSHGGHIVVAKRATSPKVPKAKTGVPSRAGSPLIGHGPTSPTASRATSPVAPTSPAAGASVGGPAPMGAGTSAVKALKRKATDDGQTAVGKPKKRKAHLPPGGVELEDRMVIEWLKNTPNATTRDCILHFTPYLTDEAKKVKFTALVKEVAQLSKGVLVLRPAFRAMASSPPGHVLSPAAAS
ncbi:Transcription initiation factor IIF subunit alpha [Grifola frondosa]|uniref:Transcription initiation factor IIF subunit alpha n=1 Tax=Grifola frondosa TaxID=5627 RepID=A0A1C7MJ04_GRIFR|nr:Transcription initiation factor IIF subunit alpha [Grifola frondosa]